MSSILDFLHQLHSSEGLVELITAGGLTVLILIVFAETGLLIGFFLPGDSLLITAGILSSPEAYGSGLFSPITLMITLSIAAVAGDQVNFLIGKKTGPIIFDRPDGRIIKRKHFLEAHAFYEKHGGIAIVFARFVPILRTFVPFVAGVAQMNHRKFISFNFFGGVFWVTSMVLIGYYLGQTPWAKKLHQVILIVIFISILPIIIGVMSRFLKKIKNKAQPSP